MPGRRPLLNRLFLVLMGMPRKSRATQMQALNNTSLLCNFILYEIKRPERPCRYRGGRLYSIE
jgi:hypothetical protein